MVAQHKRGSARSLFASAKRLINAKTDDFYRAVRRQPASGAAAVRPVELWLETRLPDTEARAAIMGERLARLPAPIGTADVSLLAVASYGLTGADLKAIVEDGKLSFAHDVANGRTPRPADDYFLEAVEAVRTNRRNYSRRKPAVFSEAVRIGFSAGLMPRS